ncbi:Putative peptidoglycan binding domain-containing protein [Caloramator quimbayensis]|uniref:Putative peptidoglycan binding domain-containing protein n=1 Tax=Caloramator quimbayensis TaxID=1147123 RepID=A0A1T4XEC1_9CLOT|nr:peptidoglycan-binding domain-containing protein [Caloramator quimbayensis]SKA87892.1 Putative peptidoglycan binding domain-containing protein [Caloramator quimbayensis]
MKKNVKLLAFGLVGALVLSTWTIGPSTKFFGADTVSAATTGESSPSKTPTTTTKVPTTSKTSTVSKTSGQLTRLLALHSYGEDVKLLQTLLNQLGYKLKVDGIYGPKTLAAVKSFQIKKGLKADGVVGPKTFAKFNIAPAQTTVPIAKEEKATVMIGKVDYAAHGTKCFTVAVAAVSGDKIVAAYIDDYQYMPKDAAKGVPNSDADFGKNYPEGNVLGSKMTNAEYYSQNMKTKAQATVPIDKNFAAIEQYVKGKTIKELEAVLSSTPKDKMADAVSGATLADTYGYVSAIVEAAKAAKSDVSIQVDAKELSNVKIGKVDYAAHGTKCFTVAVAAVVGDKVVASYIDDYQFMPKDAAKGVPNSDADFGKNYPQGNVLGSKMTNADYYSQNMKTKANATVPIDKNFDAIRKYVTGKTIAELEAALSSTPKDKMADAVSGATLADTYGYISAIVNAAKAAK